MPDAQSMIERVQWEYMTIHHEVDDSELNKNGRHGWEAVSAYVMPDGALRTLFKRSIINAALEDGR